VSLGYIGYCKKVSEDDLTVFYAYSGADWNNKSQEKADETAFDGVLAIDKSVLLWEPSKPRKQTEYLNWAHSALKNGQAVIITECSTAFRRGGGGGIDYIARLLFYDIFEHLHKNGSLPDKAAFIQ
jgi:hypothetical protein